MKWMSWFGSLSQDIGIDLGTANTLVWVRNRGIVITEPSVVARHKETGAVLAVGTEAKRMMGKTPKTIEAVRPLRNGVIADFDGAEAMLRYYVDKIHDFAGIWRRFLRPRIAIGIPSGVTEVERRAVQEAALSAGAREAYLIEEPMATAIGAGLKVLEPEGRMIVDIGGGTAEIAVISLGGLVINRSIRTAGDELDDAIVRFARVKYGLLIGEATAEQVKIQIGSVYRIEKPVNQRISRSVNQQISESVNQQVSKSVNQQISESVNQQVSRSVETLTNRKADQLLQIVVRGRDLGSGLPRSIKFNSNEVREALVPVVQQIVQTVKDVLEETPPELLSDILEGGIVLAGGSSMLMGLDKLIAEETKMPVWRMDNPMTGVVRGCGIVLGDELLLSRVKVVGGLR